MNNKPKVEKVWGFTVASFCTLMLIYVAKFLIDKFALPLFFIDNNTINLPYIIAWLVSNILVIVLCMQFLSRFGYFYTIGSILYTLLYFFAPPDFINLPTGLFLASALLVLAALEIIERIIMHIYIIIGFITM